MKKVKQYLLSRFVVFLNYNNLSNKKWLTYDVASMIVENRRGMCLVRDRAEKRLRMRAVCSFWRVFRSFDQ